MFAWLHTKSATYKMVTFAVFGAECIFGWRTGAMYQDALSQVITNPWELYPLTILFSVAVAVFGFALATHRQYGFEAVVKRLHTRLPPGAVVSKGTVRGERWQVRLAVVFFISQDIAGVVYSVFGHGAAPTFPLVVATISMSGFAIAPFFTGHMTLALAEALPEERREQFYATIFQVWQDVLLVALGKWAKQARAADPTELLLPVIQGFLASHPDSLYAEAIKSFFKMEDDHLIPFRPKATTTNHSRATVATSANSTTSRAGDEDEEELE